MNFLVDTDVFSEEAKLRPDLDVRRWLQEHAQQVYVSSITIGEIRRGIERLESSSRQEQLRHWLISLCAKLEGRILNFNASTAHVWGQLRAGWEVAGVGVPLADSQIAAIAHRHRLTIVTRNTKDYLHTGIRILNPFA